MPSPGFANRVSREPLRRVDALGRGGWMVMIITIAIAISFHAGAVVRTWLIPVELINWTKHISLAVSDGLNETYDIEPIKAPDAAPVPEPEPDPAPVAPVVKVADQPAAPPAAAQASNIISQEQDPNEPVDLTNAFVTGNAATYAGGVTQSSGTSTDAVRNGGAKPGGIAGSTGNKPGSAVVGTGPDRSRGIQLSGSAEWRCPFPAEADSDQIDDAYATVAVTVAATGKVESASVVVDPGHGFGREARACALRENFVPALDHDGTPIRSSKSFRIHFER